MATTDVLVAITADLAAEHDALDARVAELSADDWDRPTPAEGWSIRDSISHLAYYDGIAVLALTDPEAFSVHLAEFDPGADVVLGRSSSAEALLTAWRDGRAAFLAATAQVDASARVPWYGPAMSPASLATARLMETWAHGMDVGDALGLEPSVTGRLRHVVHIGVRARTYAFMVHGLDDPGTLVTVVASAPDGSEWTWTSGSSDSPSDESLSGPALDLALVFTQRRHPSDTAVVADGSTAEKWLAIAQAYAGPAGPGRAPSVR